MLLLAISLAAAPPAKPPVAQRIAQASVVIVEAQLIRFERLPVEQRGPRRDVRQHRVRDGMPMVEFY